MIIAGGGIAGLTTALTLHQLGIPCRVFETVSTLRPLGVGINLQPNAVRELFELGISEAELGAIGIPCREWALVGLNGNDIYSEPRGLEAGYRWPQYSVHRGELLMLLYRTAIERLGADVIHPGHRVVGYRQHPEGIAVDVEHGGRTQTVVGALLIAADGIHSAVRAQMYPAQPPIHWGGAVMWRGTSLARPVRTGASFVGLGTNRQRVVFYPISPADPVTGLAIINWIAEITVDQTEQWSSSDWNQPVDAAKVCPYFDDWRFGWLDVPELIQSAKEVLEYPMVDRDPIPCWQDGAALLLGDAAHPMYPTGSNGATQAIVDARILGKALLTHGVRPEALASVNAQLCDPVAQVVLRNRGAGPFGILNIVDERCGNRFDAIEDVISQAEMAEFMATYKRAAGYAMEALNEAPPTIPPF